MSTSIIDEQHSAQAGARPHGRGKSQKSLELIAAAQNILQEIQPATVRAVCYRLFVAGVIPSMEKKHTKRVSEQLVYAREEGIIPWEHIVDETRAPERVATWADPEEFMSAARRSYRRDLWADQPERIEVWSEKGTVRGTLFPVLDEYGVAFRVAHGFSSATAINEAAEDSIADERPFTILYVGDHDPSGMYMSESDLPERLERYGGVANIKRVAVLAEEMRALPTFRAADKTADARYRWYVERYGQTCCELDALSPPDLRQRVREAIQERLDIEAWNHALWVWSAERQSMSDFFKTWKGISGRVRK